MRKIILIVPMIFLFSVYVSFENVKAEFKPIISNTNELSFIKVQSMAPYITEHENYDYTAKKNNEITYLAHFFNSLAISESVVATSNDSISFWVQCGYIDEMNSFDFSLYPGGIFINVKEMYSISSQNYQRLLDFIYALKTGKIMIGDEVTFQPSEWAESVINQAIKDGLVPKWNQINYAGYITRVEVCQLIENLLFQLGCSLENLEEKPFVDTEDNSVILLHDLGIISGKLENQFCPYDYITREELAKILSNTYHYLNKENLIKEGKVLYTDKDEISDWAVKSVEEMSALGIFVGTEDGKFMPGENTTKEQVILTILKLKNQVIK